MGKEEASNTENPPITGAKGEELSEDQRRHYVEVAAFYIAERRGFGNEREMDDWIQAEVEIDRLLQEGILKPES
jgi:hypothetical protein